MMNPQHRPLGQLDGQLQFAADGFHVIAQSREVHVSLLLDFGDGWLSNIQSGSDIRLSFARDLTKFAQTLDHLGHTLLTRIYDGLLVMRKASNDMIGASTHLAAFP